VAGGKVASDAGFLNGGQAGKVHRRDGRLKVDGLSQGFHGALEAVLGNVCAGDIVDSLEDFPDKIVFLVQVLSHTHSLGALSGK
jgi:hypothetical protein